GQGAPRGRSRESLISPEPGSTRIIASRPAGGAFTLPLREKLGGTEVLRAHPSPQSPRPPGCTHVRELQAVAARGVYRRSLVLPRAPSAPQLLEHQHGAVLVDRVGDDVRDVLDALGRLAHRHADAGPGEHL